MEFRASDLLVLFLNILDREPANYTALKMVTTRFRIVVTILHKAINCYYFILALIKKIRDTTDL